MTKSRRYFAKCIYLGDLLTLISINECRRSYYTRFGTKADDLFSNDCGFLIGSSPLTQIIICFHQRIVFLHPFQDLLLYLLSFKLKVLISDFYLKVWISKTKKYQRRTLFDESTQNFSYRQILTVKIVKIRQIYLKPKAKCITWFTSLKTTFLDN